MRLEIKPLSVNEAWKGRRFKTDKYKKYERDVLMILPPMTIPDGNLSISIEWGFSNDRSDVDNPAKMFIDCLQKKYKFNDSRVVELALKKTVTKKGMEFISFDISPALSQ